MNSTRIQLRGDDYKPLRDVVFEGLREAIVSGRLEPGERLMEVHLAEEMGVSRTPVREAIRKLELEGFVVILPRRGAYVADLSAKEIADVFEIREALEELAVALAAERISDDQISELTVLLDEIVSHLDEQNVDALVQADIRFHDAIFRASQNSRLSQMASLLREQVHRYRKKSLSYPGRIRWSIAEHRDILEALAARDPARARAAVRNHIESAEHSLIGVLEKEGK